MSKLHLSDLQIIAIIYCVNIGLTALHSFLTAVKEKIKILGDNKFFRLIDAGVSFCLFSLRSIMMIPRQPPQ